MSDNVTQNDAEQQSGQKTIVAFIVGLLIGGLVVWMFSSDPVDQIADPEQPESEEQAEHGNEDNGQTATSTEDSSVPLIETDTGTTGLNNQAPTTMEIGDGAVSVSDQNASTRITLDAVIFPMADGWIGVREYMNGNLGALLGVVRFSQAQGLVPQEIILQRSITVGEEYAIVFYTPSDDNQFNLGVNSQIDGIFATFVAQ